MLRVYRITLQHQPAAGSSSITTHTSYTTKQKNPNHRHSETLIRCASSTSREPCKKKKAVHKSRARRARARAQSKLFRNARHKSWSSPRNRARARARPGQSRAAALNPLWGAAAASRGARDLVRNAV